MLLLLFGDKASVIVYYDGIDSPIGVVYVVFEGEVLKAVTLERPRCVAHSVSPAIRDQFDEYFAGSRVVFDMRFSLEGVTSFCLDVYTALERVPYGNLCTYKELAKWVGVVGGARAVGQALKKNPLPIVIPCHRVIASDGSLGGFLLGLDVKRWLLEKEKTKKEGGSAPSSDLPRKGTSPLDPIFAMLF
ncbi:Methylated-DNA-[protein]-cysteine S-methyltransferase, DNA binding domain protein [Candidatus Magnetobacterium bavaricum]|uniref:methylated-DNA--[protein]-cysteine S-methyltransferase n=1 Tax=Candidatus Magnetobacterium bavaricum TaxID=29290 RepID=A0A0F3GXG9_9BACT|nr:Methylated-DNA-[protein]-cysteine S-methyltransferase, DNA binding domain protein [Candidatus Magnetobacterium bavaricum]